MWRLLAGASATALASAGSGCAGGTAPSASIIEVPNGDELPAGQRGALRDGSVTALEYTTAFDSFVRCAIESGGLVREESLDELSRVIMFSSGSPVGSPREPNLATVEGTCYHETFSWIEFSYQTSPYIVELAEAQELQQYNTVVRPCLLAQGLDAPQDIVVESDVFGDLVESFNKLSAAGTC